MYSFINNLKNIDNSNLTIIGNGRSGNVYKINDYIVKKDYTNNAKKRMKIEIKALSLLQKYIYFPKILHIDYDNDCIYMSYVGNSIRKTPIKLWPHNWQIQIDNIIKILNYHKIFHNDLSISHIMLHNGILSLIDFEKSCVNCCQIKLKEGKDYKYTSMEYLRTIMINYINKRRR